MMKRLKVYQWFVMLILILTVVLFNAVSAQAITWTYYDIDNKILQNPTEEEIDSMAIMRVSDTGVTQYVLEIKHDFSGTWGTGYLENIGNPSPGVGKHWINAGEEVFCNVDGIVQDVYNMNSRYISTGYYAKGAPNTDDKANALSFDGSDDYVQAGFSISSPQTISIEFQLKRDRTQLNEYIIAHNNGFQIGFDSDDNVFFDSPHGRVTSNSPTYTGWHQWKFVYSFFQYTYHTTYGDGVKLSIYRDGEKLAEQSFNPECETETKSYYKKITEKYCFLPSKNYSTYWHDCVKSSEWGNYGQVFSSHPVQICRIYSSDDLDKCSVCWERSRSESSESVCNDYWFAYGTIVFHNNPVLTVKKNHYGPNNMMHSRKKTILKNKNLYSCNSITYAGTDKLYIGKGYNQQDFFKGQIKDVLIYDNNKVVGQWHLNDGVQSTIAKDTSTYNRDGNLINFDSTNCWIVDPKLSKLYSYINIKERQSVPKFLMNSPSTITYDWGRQHAVVINTLPEHLNQLSSIEVIKDESQMNFSGAGKFWYNYGTHLMFKAEEDSCQKLAGYRDNIIDPNITNYYNYYEIQSLESPASVSWIYESYVFEETVVLGTPVSLLSVPPEIIEKIDLSKKPLYTSTSVEESDILDWNDFEKKLFPLRANETFDIEYELNDTTCEGMKVIIRVTTIWPETAHFIHVANTPPVHLDPDNTDDVTFIDIKHVEEDATVSGNKFSATKPGRSVLLFKRNYIDNTHPKEISLEFNGKSYAETDSIAIAQNFTIEFFAKRTRLNNYQVIIGQGLQEYGKWISIGFTDDNHFMFEVAGDLVESSNAYTDNEWHHWACVSESTAPPAPTNLQCINNYSNYRCKWNDSSCFTTGYIGAYDYNSRAYQEQMYRERRFISPPYNSRYYVKRACNGKPGRLFKIYCDGVLIAQKESQIKYNSSGNIKIGMSPWDESDGFEGQVDEVRIWNTKRTKQEIESSMNQSLAGNENNLVAYYPIDRIGASYLEGKQTAGNRKNKIALLNNIDPANAWKIDTDKLYSINPSKISNFGKTCVRVVQTRLETEEKRNLNSYVGYEIEGTLFHDERVPHNGYVFFDKVPYNANIYDRKSLQGTIYPVNIKHPASDARHTILVIWYTFQDGISWPYQPVEYQSSWPTDLDSRIVIASRLGSEGKNPQANDQTYPDINNEQKNYFDPARYSDIIIYNQPNKDLPGYNPNEEHAMVTSSFRHSSASPCPQAAFALRNDLNITTNDEKYTSDPFVLVQYLDNVLGKHGMKAYKVITADESCGYTFRYDMKAGDIVVAPYPLNEAIGATPPEEIFGTNSNPAQRCYFKDHKGQSWAVSGAGHPLDIAEISVSEAYTDHVDYQIKLASHTMNYNDRYLIKVVDQRGFMGMNNFTVGKRQAELNKSAVYVDGQEISHLGTSSFLVSLRPGTTDLQASHFKLFHYESSANITVHYWYPLQPAFWYGEDTPGNGTGNVGQSIPWLPDGVVAQNDGFPEDMIGRSKSVMVTYDVTWPPDTPVLKAGESLTFPGGEYRADHSTYPGLPGVLAWATGQVVYDSLNPSMDNAKLYEKYLVRLVPALLEREVDLSIDQFTENLKPASGRVDVIMNRWYFKELHAGLKSRIYYDPMTQKLGIRGFINDKTLGDDTLTASPPSIYILQPNILTDRELTTIQNIEGADNAFKAAAESLYQLSRNPNQLENSYAVGLESYDKCLQFMVDKHPKQAKYLQDMFYAWLGTGIINETNRIIPQVAFGPGLAVVPNGGLLDPNDSLFSNFTEGYITLIENNHPEMGALPVSLYVIKVVKEKIRGAIKTVYADNVFDEKLTLRHSADFGADPNDLIFQWWYREQDGTSQATPDIVPDRWLVFPDFSGKNGLGMSEISMAGAGAVLLVDNLFYTRYRHVNSDQNDPDSWSDWAGAANSNPGHYQAQLAEGWVKRVINCVNPFESRINSFYNSDSPATYVSMIRQAGPMFEGPVAFNPQKDVIENVGLIELYQTVLERAKDLSIDLEQPTCSPGIVSALLLATSRISGFYCLLGNEAYNDAQDPTIGFGSESIEYGSLAPTIFTFMNQLSNLIDEEYALLCGRGETGARPVYNRLLWNFTKGNGEVAYALSYNINDVNLDGFVDESDARILYPQGHGDAWGHYLTAVKCYYDLLCHPHFIWESRSEKFSIEGVVIDVDYLDERKFAEAAASKAKVGSEIVNITYRKKYVEDPDGQWQGYQDIEKSRSWGVSGWATRTYLAALFDWAMANAILPSKDDDPTHTGIKKIDRSTVSEILDIASQARNIQTQFDNANIGLNPLGLASDVVPFDINPARMIPGLIDSATHFEQSYEHAVEALENARAIFDHANEVKDQIRKVIVSEQEFSIEVMDQDRKYRNQLIEIFGTPYEGTIGAGKAYPTGYKGPDYYYYNYIDVNEVSEETIPPPSDEMIAYFQPSNVSYEIESGTGSTQTDIPAIYSEFFGSDLEGSDYMNTDFSDVLEIKYPLSSGKYSFQAPEYWGMRTSPGEIQIALIELVKAEADLQLALFQYNEIIGDISDTMALVQGRSDMLVSELDISTGWSEKTETYNNLMMGLRTGAEAAEIAADFVDDNADAAAEYLPKVLGAMGADTTSAARGALKTAGAVSAKVLRLGAFSAKTASHAIETDKELAEIDMGIELNKVSYRHDIQQYLEEVEGLLGREAPSRLEVFKRREHMRQVSEKYRSILAKGLRLLEERKVYNARVAQKTQGKRYMDMAFRVTLNQALSQYRNAFDLAARYVYLAAKAYDYETNLSDRDPVSASPLLTNIIRQRLLGQYENGQYIIGQGGLGEILSTLKINFNVLKGQMGFQTPQTETGRFSLRTELFRIKQGEDNQSKWQDELKKKYVADLWKIPEFRNYCRPFASESIGEQPGIVIDFSTKILFGKNFFGWPLSGGDHAYDPTNFATKVRSVGVWFEGYNNSLLSETPRVYLIPTGMDVMLVPNSMTLDTREWSIVDQKLPLPLPVKSSDLANPDWIPSLDSVDGSMIKIRRFSSFRAYHDSGYFDESQVNYESRLIGRSVWNSRWLLIIPGGTFHYDQDYGLKTFIENVTDIKLFFQTYAISGS